MACFGSSSGAVPPVSLEQLRQKSLILTWTKLNEYTSNVAELEASAAAFFASVASGAVKPLVHKSLALNEAATAHRLLESRATHGSLVLIP